MALDQTIQPVIRTSAASFSDTLGGKVVLTVGASLFVAACAHMIVPAGFTPVPFTLGDLAVILVGLVLGPALGFSALALYLLEGACGLPVFSPAGPGGLAQLMFGATSGYLIAYPFAAALAGGLYRLLAKLPLGRRTRFGAALLGAAAGSTLLMVSGTVWLGNFLHLAPAVALSKGAWPFVPGQIVKVVSAAGIATSLQRFKQR
jgi:biotin transport system substrate-specific component